MSPLSRPSAVVTALALVVAGAHAIPSRPNIVMLFVDDMGYGDVGFTGDPNVPTPNVDRLAYGGMRLGTWYSGAPYCSASRAALLTGRQTPRTGVPPVLSATGNQGLPLNETTIGQLAKSAGYATGIFGKWHLGQMDGFLPGQRGFDSYLGIPYSVDMGMGRLTPCNGSAAQEKLNPRGSGRVEDSAGDPASNWLPLVAQKGNGNSTNTTILQQPLDLTTLAEEYSAGITQFITENAGSPFFLYVPFNHVHTTDMSQPDMQYSGCRFRGVSPRGGFGDAVMEMDWLVGNIDATLTSLGLSNNTLILFTGDNGPWLPQGERSGSMGPFIGRSAGYYNTGKGSTWEGGIRMAGFAYWPTVIPGNSFSREIVSTLDVFPTVANLTGATLPSDRPYDGKNMLPVLLGQASQHDFLFFYNGKCNGNLPCAVRYGDYKAHFMTGPGAPGWMPQCLPTDRNCTVIKHNPPLLFNVERDPAEAFPLTQDGVTPTDPTVKQVLLAIETALANEAATMTWGTPGSNPNGVPGQNGVCCDRTKKCNCSS